MREETTIVGFRTTEYNNGLSDTYKVPALYYLRDRPDPSRQPKPRGFLPSKGYEYNFVRSAGGYYSAQSVQPPTSTLTLEYGDTAANGISDIIFPSSLEQRAIIKALTRLKDMKVNLGVAFAEAQETANSLASLSRRLAQGYRRLAARDPKGAARALWGQGKGSVPKRWLEYQYSINPLLQDINGAVAELQGSADRGLVVRVEGSVGENQESESYNGFGSFSGVVRTSTSLRCKVVLKYRPESAVLQSIARLGLSNPFEVAWEKVPFSFVLDWFIPVGDFLHVLDASTGFEFLDGSCTHFGRTKMTHSPTEAYNGALVLGPHKSGRGERVRMVRGTYPYSPLPSYPSIKSPLSLGHMANGLSLLSQVFKPR